MRKGSNGCETLVITSAKRSTLSFHRPPALVGASLEPNLTSASLSGALASNFMVLDTNMSETQTRYESLEAQIRAEHDPSHPNFETNMLRSVRETEGYYRTRRIVFGETKDKHDFRLRVNKAIDQMVRDGKLERDIYGKLWTAGRKPPLVSFLIDWIPAVKLVAKFAVFVGMFLATMTQGPLLIAAHGVLGYVLTTVGILLAFLAAGWFWTSEGN